MKADVDALKSALAGDDDEAIKSAVDKLNESQTKLGEAIYAQAQQEEPQDGSSDESTSDDEDVVDAEVVDEDDEDEKK